MEIPFLQRIPFQGATYTPHTVSVLNAIYRGTVTLNGRQVPHKDLELLPLDRLHCEAHNASACHSFAAERPLTIKLANMYTSQDENGTITRYKVGLEDEVLLPLFEYSPIKTFRLYFDMRHPFTTAADWWDLQIYLIHFDRTDPAMLRESIGELILLREVHALNILSHGQRLPPEGGTTLWGVLFSFMDWQCVTASNLILICVICMFLLFGRRHPMIRIAQAVRRLSDWMMVYCGQSDQFVASFIDPLIKRFSGRATRAALRSLSVLLMIWGFLYVELFGTDLLGYLIKAPFLYIDSAADFLRHHAEYNLTFWSMMFPLKVAIERLNLLSAESVDSDLMRIADEGLERVFRVNNSTDFLELTAAARNTSLVLNLYHVSCDFFKLQDPLWTAHQYRCLTQDRNMVYFIVRKQFLATRSARRVVRILRAITEAYLQRRLHRDIKWTYHLNSMNTAAYEPQADLQLVALNVAAISTILINMVAIYVLLTVCHTLASIAFRLLR